MFFCSSVSVLDIRESPNLKIPLSAWPGALFTRKKERCAAAANMLQFGGVQARCRPLPAIQVMALVGLVSHAPVVSVR